MTINKDPISFWKVLKLQFANLNNEGMYLL